MYVSKKINPLLSNAIYYQKFIHHSKSYREPNPLKIIRAVEYCMGRLFKIVVCKLLELFASKIISCLYMAKPYLHITWTYNAK